MNTGTTRVRTLFDSQDSQASSDEFTITASPSNRNLKESQSGSVIFAAEEMARSGSILAGSQQNMSHHDEAESYALSDVPSEQKQPSIPFHRSVRFSFLVVFSLSLLLIVLSSFAIWIPALCTSLFMMGESSRTKQFDNIMLFIDRQLQDTLLLSENLKNILRHDFNYSSPSVVEGVLFRVYKSEKMLRNGLISGFYIGYMDGTAFGMANLSSSHYFIEIGSSANLYECKKPLSTSYCWRNSTPDIVMEAPNLSSYIERGKTFVDQPSFSLSFMEKGNSDSVNLFLVNSVGIGTNQISFYVGCDVSMQYFSLMLARLLSSIESSISFVLESPTGLIVSSSSNDTMYSFKDSDTGVVVRHTGFTVNSRIGKITSAIQNKVGGNLRLLRCNERITFSTADEFVIAQRTCKEENVDWIVVMAVKQWTFVDSMVLSIIVAFFCSIGVVAGGILGGVWISNRIFEPLTDLLEIIKSASSLQVEFPKNFETSYFTEMSEIQTAFVNIVKKIKSYRAFIPAHLLQELEPMGENSTPTKFLKAEKRPSFARRLSSRVTTALGKRFHAKDRFAIGLEDRKVTQMCLYIQGFKSLLEEAEYSDIVSLLGEVYETLLKTSKVSNGQLGQFENNLLTMSWNTTKDQPDHETKGVSTCVSFLQKMNSIKDTRWKSYEVFRHSQKLYEGIHFRIGITSQHCKCGNVGTEDFKSYTIMGSIQQNNIALIDIAKRLNIGLVTTEQVYYACMDDYAMRYLETKELVVDVRSRKPVSPAERLKPFKIFEIGDSLAVGMDEWMVSI